MVIPRFVCLCYHSGLIFSRLAFPTMELVKVDKADGATDFQYRGLRRRPVPKPFSPQGNIINI